MQEEGKIYVRGFKGRNNFSDQLQKLGGQIRQFTEENEEIQRIIRETAPEPWWLQVRRKAERGLAQGKAGKP